MSRIAAAAKVLLADIKPFSALVMRQPLRRYQLRPLAHILASILHRHGLEFLLIFPRQSGKNETVAQLLVYLLNLYRRVGGNIIYGATGDGLGMGIERLEARLDNPWNAGRWFKKTHPTRRTLGQAAIVFLSTHPQASTRGQTAHHLLVIDETQDQLGPHIEAVFTPMRAANNATALYIGTVKLTSDYLWQKKLELERETRRDGRPRVFMVQPEEVCAENRAYKDFLDAQVRKYGRNHPIVASEYFLEPIDATGGLFPERRRALMHGTHPRQTSPRQTSPLAGGTPVPVGYPGEGGLFVATLDDAGEDEAATDPIAQLANPGRDYTLATVFRVRFPGPGAYAPGPTYEAVDVFVDHGSKHFQDIPGQPALVHRLAAWLNSWQVAHLVSDESGVGLGLTSWLTAALGAHRVTGFNFAGRKALLGSMFLSLVETGRFRYWTGDEDEPLSDGWWFWQQVTACQYEVPPDGKFDRDLRWQVPPSHKTPTPLCRPAEYRFRPGGTGQAAGSHRQGSGTLQPTHDDRLLSAALIAELDRLYRECRISLGTAQSAVIQGKDPLDDLTF